MVKNHGSMDQRIVNPSTNKPSRSRMLVLEALEAQGKEGATVDEIDTMIGSEFGIANPKMSIGQALSRMEADQYVACRGDRWWLTEHYPQPSAQNGGTVSHTSNGRPAQIAPMVQKRSGRTVALYTAPTVFADVISLALLIKEQWFEIPFWGAIRVCVGHDIPDWSADKRWYYNVTTLKIMFKGGQVEERQPDSKDVVTIDAEE